METSKILSKEDVAHEILGAIPGLSLYASKHRIIVDGIAAFTKQEIDKVFEFAKWASHSDWVWLPSKEKWYNEEDEHNITPKSTDELYELFLKDKNKTITNGNTSE